MCRNKAQTTSITSILTLYPDEYCGVLHGGRRDRETKQIKQTSFKTALSYLLSVFSLPLNQINPSKSFLTDTLPFGLILKQYPTEPQMQFTADGEHSRAGCGKT